MQKRKIRAKRHTKPNRELIKEFAILLYAWEFLKLAAKNLSDEKELSDADAIALKIYKDLTRLVNANARILPLAADELNKAVRGLAQKDEAVNNATFAFALLDFYKVYFPNRKIDITKKSELWDLIDMATEDLKKRGESLLLKKTFDAAEALVKRVKGQK